MRDELLTDIGGFLWWLIVRRCKTELKKEQTKENWSRNYFFLIVIVFLIALMTLKVVPFVRSY